MNKLNAIAVTATAALIALTGCTTDEPAEKPVETAQAAEATTPAATKSAVKEDLAWEVQDPDTWTKYTLDFTEYSNELTDRTDNALKAADAKPVTWATATIDNTEGRDQGTLSYAEIVLVDDEGKQYYPTADITETVSIETEAYQDKMLDQDSGEYNKLVDLNNDWLDANQDAVPGAKTDNVLMVTDMPDTIVKVYLNNTEATPKK